MTHPFNGARTSNWYVEETTAGVTPDNPVWTKIRDTGGIPTLIADTIESDELNDSREKTIIDIGNKRTEGEFAFELSSQSQDDIIAAAMTSTWQSGFTEAAVEITVDAAAKTFTRTAGDFITDGVKAGDLIAFPSLTGNNAKASIVTEVTALVVTLGTSLKLEDEAAATTDYIVGDFIGTGSECKTVSILTWLRGKCGTVDKYFVTTGVEFTGFSVEAAVNARITGSAPIIGRELICDDAPPTGSTFNPDLTSVGYKPPLVGAVLDGATKLVSLTTGSYTNDNNSSAQYELDDDFASFVERGTATNTFSGAAFMRDCDLLDRFIDGQSVSSHVVANGAEGAMSFSTPVLRLTAVTPDRGGDTSITQTIEGTATGNTMQSSLVVQRIIYP